MNRAWDPTQSRRGCAESSSRSFVFGLRTRVPKDGLWTAVRRLCLAQRTVDRFNRFGTENGLRVACSVSRHWSPLLCPLVVAAVKKTYVLVPVIEKRPRNHSHHLAWRVVHNYGCVIANAQCARNASEFFSARHIAIGRPRNTAKPAQVYRAGNMTGAVLVRWPRIDDAHVRAIQLS